MVGLLLRLTIDLPCKNRPKLALTEFNEIITENICNRKNKAVPLHAGNENTHVDY